MVVRQTKMVSFFELILIRSSLDWNTMEYLVFGLGATMLIYVDCRLRRGQQSSNFNTSKVKKMPSQALSGWCGWFGKGAASKLPTGRIYWDGQYKSERSTKSENVILKYWISLAYIMALPSSRAIYGIIVDAWTCYLKTGALRQKKTVRPLNQKIKYGIKYGNFSGALMTYIPFFKVLYPTISYFVPVPRWIGWIPFWFLMHSVRKWELLPNSCAPRSSQMRSGYLAGHTNQAPHPRTRAEPETSNSPNIMES